MEFFAKAVNTLKHRTNCLVVTVSQPRQLSVSASKLDEASGGFLTDILKRGDMDGLSGQTLLLHAVPGVAAERVLLLGIGKIDDLNERSYDKAIDAMYNALSNSGSKDAHVCLAEVSLKNRDAEWKIRQSVMCLTSKQYLYEQTKSQKSDRKIKLNKLSLDVETRAQV